MFGESLLLKGVRVVDFAHDGHKSEGSVGANELVDVHIEHGRVRAVQPKLPDPGCPSIDADGRWLIPGLWDAHVHADLWSTTPMRLALNPSDSLEETLSTIAERRATLPPGEDIIEAAGFRPSAWPQEPTVAQLDQVTGDIPTIVISGDVHSGWLNTAALGMFNLASRKGIFRENEWFALLSRMETHPALQGRHTQGHVRMAQDAAAKGVVGVVDMSFSATPEDWPKRYAAGVDQLRVRFATYPHGLEERISMGLRTRDALPGSPLNARYSRKGAQGSRAEGKGALVPYSSGAALFTQGPLKIIVDGSLGTRTAWCRHAYPGTSARISEGGPQGALALGAASPSEDPGAHAFGVSNIDTADLRDLVAHAASNGITVALHAIGDQALDQVIGVLEDTAASGSIEHLQMATDADIERIAVLGRVNASVQPAHLLDDRDLAASAWPGREDLCFRYASLARAGVELKLGSDAPVSPLDPWLAMAAAVFRSADEREAWNPSEALTPAQALAASVDGQGVVAPGSRGDVVLLDANPLADQGSPRANAQWLRGMPVALTVMAGGVTHVAL
ncbi:MAG: amidohydrolase family protein [Actinomycetaceae bacterium]|nr:amidohydrolase family protein [Actinomycetaceae bacterium]